MPMVTSFFLPKIVSCDPNWEPNLEYKTQESSCFDVQVFTRIGNSRFPTTCLQFEDTSFKKFIRKVFLNVFGIGFSLELLPKSSDVNIKHGEIDVDYPGIICSQPVVPQQINFTIQAKWSIYLVAPGVKRLNVVRTGGFGSTSKEK
jgi:hypothetical protein